MTVVMDSPLASAPTTPGMRCLIDAGLSDTGLVRPANEDALVRRPEAGLWAVADGMGGHTEGAWASAAVARALEDVELSGEFDADVARAEGAIQAANAEIWSYGQRLGGQTGSTVTALLVGGGRYGVLWAGDSRAYLLRAGTLQRLTSDHTHVQDRLDQGLLTPEEAFAHPLRHVLTRAVGVRPSLDLARRQGPVQPGDVLLLCSDGVHGVMAEAEVADALSGRDPDAACRLLQRLCHARGAPDNLTMAVLATFA